MGDRESLTLSRLSREKLEEDVMAELALHVCFEVETVKLIEMK